MDTKKLLGLISLASGAGYIYLSMKPKSQLLGKYEPVKFNPHKAVDMAMGFVNMNPIAKTVISETLKKAIPEQHDGEVIDAKAKRIK